MKGRDDNMMKVLSGALIFPRGIIGGISAVVLMWIAVLCFSIWRSAVAQRNSGMNGLTAVSGGWANLIHSPGIVVLLTVSFGFGFYLATRP